ncbi:crossover junction endodeoxyribonuclease RuvC [soil metagenome]
MSDGVVVLGLDPGTRHFGWGVVRRIGTRLTHVAHGVVSVADEGPLGERLVAIESALADVLTRFAPNEASIESIFFAKNASSAGKLGHARGVGLLVCARAGLAVFEYPPARVKLTVTGAGRADKSQVAHMIRIMLGLAASPPSDAADALAIAVTHLQGRALPGTRTPISRAMPDR